MKSLESDLVELGAVEYSFPKEVDGRIEPLCHIKGVPIYEVPEIVKMKPIENIFLSNNIKGHDKCFVIRRRLTNEIIICIRPCDFVERPITELEFGLWHEYGHIDCDNPIDEKYADNYARARLTERYGKDESDRIYLDFILNEYQVDTSTGKPAKPITGGYIHRLTALTDYFNK